MKIRQINAHFSWYGKTILFVMRAFIGLFCMVAFGFSSKHGLSQTTVVIDADTTMTVYQVFGLIKKQTGSTFLYDYDMFKDSPAIRLKKGTVKTGTLLDKIRNTGNFKYEYTADKTVIFSKIKDSPSSQPDNRPVIRQLRVTGTVTDPNGAPLPGVNIVVKDARYGTMSDEDGNYSILVNATDVLTFSFVGFKKVELAVDGREVIDVQMEEDVMSLEGVEVNAGYYTVKDRERTGNISRITAEDIQKQPVANPLAAIQGRMPGVMITQRTGLPGGGFDVLIRGKNSLRNQANDPLYIVDGVPFPSVSMTSSSANLVIPSTNPLNSINPSDIESVEVLKDADATAIYGSRGANGVVLITTKKGKMGKTMVSIDFWQGLGKVSNFMDLLNTEQYLEMRLEGFVNDGIEPGPYEYDVNGTWDQNRYTDWQEKLIGGTAETSNVKLSVSGGNERTSFLLGGGYYRETTVFPGDFSYQRGSLNMNVNHTSLNGKFMAKASVKYATDKNNLLRDDLTGPAVTLPPNAPEVYDENGDLNWENNTWYNNPFIEIERKYKRKTDNLIVNTGLGYHIISGLMAKVDFGLTNIRVDEVSIIPIRSNNPNFTTTGTGFFGKNKLATWIVEPQLNYRKYIAGGELNILVGTTFQKSTQENQSISGRGYTSDALLENISAAPETTVTSASEEYKYYAIFGRINYNWKDKYLINLTGRRDGSSRFGPGKRFGNFGAIGAAWLFSNENFIKNISFMNYGKLRGSYGITGSDQIGNYEFLQTYESTRYPYNEIAGLVPTRLPNTDYSWESNKKLEFGLELGLIDNHISLSGSWYKNRSSDQLIGLPLPGITGFTTIQANFPATVENRGWEIQLNTLNVQKKDFEWRTAFNITYPRNELIEFLNIEETSFANTYEVGKSLYILKKFHSTGVDPQTGIYVFEDVDGNGNGTDFPSDIQTLKERTQKYFGGLQNTIHYKGLQLDFLFQFVKQTGYSYLNSFISVPGNRGNQPDIVLDRWKEEGDISSRQRFTAGITEAWRAYNTFRNSGDGIIVDASYVRLKNISLSYQLPSSAIDQIGLQAVSVYAQGQNLWTLTDYVGLDPETQSSISLPPLRVITLGARISF